MGSGVLQYGYPIKEWELMLVNFGKNHQKATEFMIC